MNKYLEAFELAYYENPVLGFYFLAVLACILGMALGVFYYYTNSLIFIPIGIAILFGYVIVKFSKIYIRRFRDIDKEIDYNQ